jgi:spermidine synthase
MSHSNLEILAYEHTPLGDLCLRRRELLSQPGTLVTEVTLNHELLMSSLHTRSEQALARFALDRVDGDELRVLVGGLGLGYTAQEALASQRVVRVEVVEFLPQVIGWLDERLIPLADSLAADARLRVTQGDVYDLLSRPAGEVHDLILIDVDHSPDDRLGCSNDAFYTEEGLRRAKGHLSPGGVFAVWSYEESPRFDELLRRVFGEVWNETVTFQNVLIDAAETDWVYLARG